MIKFSMILPAAAAAAFLVVGSSLLSVDEAKANTPVCKTSNEPSAAIVDCPPGLPPMTSPTWYYVVGTPVVTEGFSDPYTNNPNSNALFHDCITETSYPWIIYNNGNNSTGSGNLDGGEEITGSKNVNANANAC